MALYSPSDFRRALNGPNDAVLAAAYDLVLAYDAGELRDDPRFAALPHPQKVHTYGASDFQRALAAPHEAATASALELSQALDAGKLHGHPQFDRLAHLVGENAARYAVRTSGGAALSDAYADHLPSDIPIDDTTRARGLATVQNSVGQISTLKGDGELAAMAQKIYGQLDRTSQARAGAATPDMSAVNALVAQEMNRIAPEAMKHPTQLASLAHDAAGAGGFFKQDAFGRIAGLLPNMQIGGSYGNGGRPHGYAELGSRWEPSSGGAGLTTHNFSGTPFHRAGLDLPTTKDLFAKGFNQQQIIAAAGDVKTLGFSPKDKEAMENQAGIRKYDNTPEQTTHHLQDLRERLQHNEEYQNLVHQLRQAKTEEERKQILAKMRPHEQKATDESHVAHDIHDPHKNPKARHYIGKQAQHLIQQIRGAQVVNNHAHKANKKQRHAEAGQQGQFQQAKAGTNAKVAKAEVKVAKADAKEDDLAAQIAAAKVQQAQAIPSQTQPAPSAQKPKPVHLAGTPKPMTPTG